jgi:S1-C subfamily serine protease
VVTDRETPSPAQQAGIRPDDVILRWNGIPIKDPASLTRLVARTEIGSTAEVVLWRRSQEVTVQVIVGRRPVNLD